jgi:hypothetical protein
LENGFELLVLINENNYYLISLNIIRIKNNIIDNRNNNNIDSNDDDII